LKRIRDYFFPALIQPNSTDVIALIKNVEDLEGKIIYGEESPVVDFDDLITFRKAIPQPSEFNTSIWRIEMLGLQHTQDGRI
jgi:hypothetical protein